MTLSHHPQMCTSCRQTNKKNHIFCGCGVLGIISWEDIFCLFQFLRFRPELNEKHVRHQPHEDCSLAELKPILDFKTSSVPDASFLTWIKNDHILRFAHLWHRHMFRVLLSPTPEMNNQWRGEESVFRRLVHLLWMIWLGLQLRDSSFTIWG